MPQKETDIPVAARLWDVPAALVLLTRLPLPALPDRAFANGARAVWAYPLVGLILALILSPLFGGLAAMGVPAPLTAGVTLGALAMLTGAMHEDGFADTADGLWGGHDITRRLEIMKDSRIGAYGVLALIIAMGLRWTALADISWVGLLAALMVSRAMMVPLMYALPHARDVGLSRSVGSASFGPTCAAVLIGAVGAILCAGAAGLVAVAAAGCVMGGMAKLARTKIGGQTGDILGATQIATEITVLVILVTLAA
ncbi:adenosylcobinamide-GDP ribazoletransferase [uncultured Tateyamaria sp.]|uniref:adenosylcobinamide-GDP ribazoletransferase n=1 Tax=uncultured Tateyamaria sp. TaxID=455651 RepID=UPI0026073FD8|nr:adenosylcobinamide-GDP ribazoletransferase [uncultured Tateyamaria sp.]